MAFSVGINSYVSVEDADAYWAIRGDDDWDSASDEEKESALVRATTYIDYNYEFVGYHKDGANLAFPRHGCYHISGNFRCKYVDSNTTPVEVKEACYELGLEALGGDLVANSTGRRLKKEKVGDLEQEYFQGQSEETFYPRVDRLLSPFLYSSHNSPRVYI